MNAPTLSSPRRLALLRLASRAGHLVAILTCLAGVALAWLLLDVYSLGLLTTVAALAGAGGRAMVHASTDTGTGTPLPRHRLVTAGAATAAIILAAFGMADLAGFSGVALVAMAVLASPSAHGPVLRRFRRRTELDWWAADGTPVYLPVGEMTVEELCEGWEASFVALGGTTDPVVVARLYHLRQAYLDELERRFPVGFARWIQQGAAPGSDPRKHLAR